MFFSEHSRIHTPNLFLLPNLPRLAPGAFFPAVLTKPTNLDILSVRIAIRGCFIINEPHNEIQSTSNLHNFHFSFISHSLAAFANKSCCRYSKPGHVDRPCDHGSSRHRCRPDNTDRKFRHCNSRFLKPGFAKRNNPRYPGRFCRSKRASDSRTV
jgi:hypothetical protein